MHLYYSSNAVTLLNAANGQKFDLLYIGKLWWWKTLANGNNNKSVNKTLANKRNSVSAGKTLWQFLGNVVGSMQVNELHKFTVTLTASCKLACA